MARHQSQSDPRIVMWQNACAERGARGQFNYAQYYQHSLTGTGRKAPLDHKGVAAGTVLSS